jgi:hypothetical protein
MYGTRKEAFSENFTGVLPPRALVSAIEGERRFPLN